MPYVTISRPQRYIQMSFDDMINGVDDISKYVIPYAAGTITRFYNKLNPKLLENTDVGFMVSRLVQFNQLHQPLFDRDRQSLYRTFYIPKRSGGLRRIDAPLPELMEALRNLKSILENDMYALYHTTAFAYVKNRSTIDSVKRHQKNESRWFLKLDFSNFFGSTTQEFLISMLSNIFPFSEIICLEDGKDALERALGLCFLNNGLPQGTPVSPMLTNLMMIPIDHKLSNTIGSRFPFNKKYDSRFIYTRYADDIVISSKYDFQWRDVQHYVTEVLKEFKAPFSINPEKTRYGSSSGSNWILGVKLNKDNLISLGHREKKYFKAMLESYVRSHKLEQDKWPIEDVYSLSGKISYYRMVERDYIDYLIRQYNEKFSTDITALIRKDLSTRK